MLQRLLTWLRSLFAAPPTPLAPPPAAAPRYVTLVHPLDEHTFTSPCQLDIFEFTITTTFVWSARQTAFTAQPTWGPGAQPNTLMSRPTFVDPAEQIPNHQPRMRAHVEAVVRQITRAYAPLDVVRAEEALNAESLRSVDFHATGLRCEVRTRVAFDEKIRDFLRGEHLERIVQRTREETARERLGRLRDQLPFWEPLIRDLVAAAANSNAVRVALRPDELDQFLRTDLRAADEERERLFRLVERVAEAHHQADVYEYVMESDGALRSLMRHLGIPEPAPAFLPAGGVEPAEAGAGRIGEALGDWR